MSYRGHFTVSQHNQLLFTYAAGGWDLITAHDYCASFKQQATQLYHQPWAHILLLDDWILATPEVEPVLKDLANWAVAHNMVCSAKVYRENMLKQYQLDRMNPKSSVNFRQQEFTEQQAALDWLASEGFKVNCNQFTKVLP
ncbi:hypothetical protein WG68_10495 [Arsukibacterium ikkense]|uniref:STAS/SEC14 domain-containing protein n=1 Tax=Arsukibacterium ikkense TaxID=336831 RepID=A0A0M2V709_9GAMM|nr:hypothetical protein [Arsukibacterium ikkense]KKO45465.1 hypothetical protein WG68_10495 [Arsukibacterium ikkense]